ncbi:MAG TPA: amylo-alpha-1,6-glucosidase [Bacillales bacterium]
MDYRVIKENDLFLLTDEIGNIREDHNYGLGLYTKDTRFLNKFDLKINDQEPILLSSEADENYLSTILLTNPHIENDGVVELWRESIEVKRQRFIFKGILYETIILKNYNPKPASFKLSMHVDADFSDMFIVRGFQNGKTGSKGPTEINEKSLVFHYEGADQVKRSSRIDWDEDASGVTEAGDIDFKISLAPLKEKRIAFRISPIVGDLRPEQVEPEQALNELKQSYSDWKKETTSVETDYQPLQKLVDRGIADLRVLLTDLGYGSFPVAGLPWFGVPFGRDSLIAAMQMLAFNPKVAKGILKTMAAYQGEKVDTWRDEQPGKIMHEMRFGELANTGQVPFTPYYGSVDSTPLFLILLGEYVNWTGDLALFEELETNVEAALKWIDEYGDLDGDGFVEYHQASSKGIANQGWKDSGDSIVHRDGSYAESPIALAEVQGYVYQAKQEMASIFEALNYKKRSEVLRSEAADLKKQFDKEFWMEDQGFYAIALDKDKKQVGSVTSNPGQALLAELFDESRAEAVVEKLVSSRMFSGYGIRTMGEGEAGYNPISYHDGSVWPHDNSLILLGMSKLRRKDQSKKVIEGLILAAEQFEYDRLPELFCGYSEKVVKYPVACSPQAWAAGTPLIFIQALLGLFPDSSRGEIHLSPVLLDTMNLLKIRQMSVGKGEIDLTIVREEGKVLTTVDRNTTGCEIVVNSVEEISV